MRALTVQRCRGLFCPSLYEDIGVERGPLQPRTRVEGAEGGELLPRDFAIASDSRGFLRNMAGTVDGHVGRLVVASCPSGSRGIFRRLIACRIFLARSQPDDRGYAR